MRARLTYLAYRYLGSPVWWAARLALLPIAGAFVPFMLAAPPHIQRGFIALCTRVDLALLALLCGVRYRVIADNDTLTDLKHHTGLLLIANHQSAFETFFFAHYVPRITFVLKRALLNIPIFGWGLRLLRPIAIDRAKKTTALKQVLTDGAARIQAGSAIMLFPEGTRLATLGAYQASAGLMAERCNCPVIPIAHNAGHLMPKGRLFNTPGTITILIGAPTGIGSDESPKAFIARVHAWTASALANIAACNTTQGNTTQGNIKERNHTTPTIPSTNA